MTKLKGVGAFTDADISFLKEYEKVMQFVANALDIIQGENRAYLGCLLPIVCLTKSKLELLSAHGVLVHCKPLVEAMLAGIDKRFLPLMTDIEYQLAAAFHPRFRLVWLEKFDAGKVPRVKAAMEEHLIKALGVSAVEGDGSGQQHTVREEEDDPFMAELFRPSDNNTNVSGRSVRRKAESILVHWLNGDTTGDFSNDTFLHEPALISLFVQFNTAIPSSAAVERFFSIGRDILRAKRTALSDANFDILMFLTGNKHIQLPED